MATLPRIVIDPAVLRDIELSLAEAEPLQPALPPGGCAVSAAAADAARKQVGGGLPGANWSPRFLRSATWVPPSARPNAKVVTYSVGSDGFRTQSVEPAKVVEYRPMERQVAVVLQRTGGRKVVPISWVMDPALAGSPQHPWRGARRHSGCAAADADTALLAPVGCAGAEASPTACDGAGAVAGGGRFPEPGGLRHALLARHGSSVAAWDALDAHGVGEVSADAFAMACSRAAHCDGIPDEVADAALEISAMGAIATWGCARHREGLAPPKAAGAPPSITFRQFSAWLDGSGDELQEQRISAFSARHSRLGSQSLYSAVPSDAGSCGARAFKRGMVMRYGNLARAWVDLDTNRDGVLQFGEFCFAVRKLGLSGNLKLTWEALVGGSDGEPAVPYGVTDVDLDRRVLRPDRICRLLPEQLSRFHSACAELDDLADRRSARRSFPSQAADVAFRNAMVKKFGTLFRTWLGMDAAGAGAVDYQQFVLFCRGVGFAGSLKKVFCGLTRGADTLLPGHLDAALPALLARQGLHAAPRSARAPTSLLAPL